MKKILDAKDVVKVYNAQGKNPFEALHDINFELEEGDFVCVMGQSGAGKSTFVNTLSTIDMPTSGVVKILDENVRNLNDKQIGKFRYEHIGFIFQEFNLIQSLTVFENIALPLVLLKKSKKEINELVNEYAKKLHLERQLKNYPSEISGGQRQRVAICRALVSKPEILVADEPTGNLDSINSTEILSYLKSINEKEGITILMVTHSNLIASYSKKFITISDGTISNTLERGNLSQKQFYKKISSLTN